MHIREFSKINGERCKNGFNHALDSWSLSDWAVALAGEVGEACNVIKKLNRIRDGLDRFNRGMSKLELRRALADEIGDIYAYLDLLAQRAELDLEECVRAKFNEVSDRIRAKEHIGL